MFKVIYIKRQRNAKYLYINIHNEKMVYMFVAAYMLLLCKGGNHLQMVNAMGKHFEFCNTECYLYLCKLLCYMFLSLSLVIRRHCIGCHQN